MRLPCFAALALCCVSPLAAQEFDSVPVADAELAQMRGGIALPGGGSVAIGIAIDTQVNGTLALRTIFTTEAAGVRSFAGAGAEPVTAAGVATSLGQATLTQGQGGAVAALAGNDIAVQQMIGQSTGTIVANTANNRMIDTITTINIDLRGQVLPSGFTSSIEAIARSVAGRGN